MKALQALVPLDKSLALRESWSFEMLGEGGAGLSGI